MRKRKGIRVIAILAFIMIFLCSCGINIGSEVTDDRNEKWARDIKQIKRELPRNHKNMFSVLSEDDYNRQLDSLKGKIKELSDDEIKVELSKIIAQIGDAHTTFVFDTSSIYPLQLYWFEEGIFVINTTEDYKAAINLKLKSINGQDASNIIEKIKPIISYENEAQMKNSIAKYIVTPEVLKGLKIISSDEVDFIFYDTNAGKELKVNVTPEGKDKLKLISKYDENELPMYRKNYKEYYWFDYIENSNTVYFKYNSCRNMEKKSFKDFNTELFGLIDQKRPNKLIIDLRNNGGGSSPLFDPFLNELKKREYLNDSKKLFVVLGRQTFSSAIINACDLKNTTKATFIGEATGGKPNHFGEVKTMLLPNNKITVSYSTKYFQMLDKDIDSMMPDILINPSFKEYINYKDDVLDTILK